MENLDKRYLKKTDGEVDRALSNNINLEFFKGGGSHTEQVRNRDPDSPEMLAIEQALHQAMMPMYKSYNPDVNNAQGNVDKYKRQYDEAYLGMNDLTTTGRLPQGMMDEMNLSIKNDLNRSLGSLMAKNAGTGVLNSSITSKGINEMGNQAAEGFGKNFVGAYGATSQNFGNMMGNSLQAQTSEWDNINKKYAGAMDYYKTKRASEDMPDYDTVVHQDGGK